MRLNKLFLSTFIVGACFSTLALAQEAKKDKAKEVPHSPPAKIEAHIAPVVEVVGQSKADGGHPMAVSGGAGVGGSLEGIQVKPGQSTLEAGANADLSMVYKGSNAASPTPRVGVAADLGFSWQMGSAVPTSATSNFMFSGIVSADVSANSAINTVNFFGSGGVGIGGSGITSGSQNSAWVSEVVLGGDIFSYNSDFSTLQLGNLNGANLFGGFRTAFVTNKKGEVGFKGVLDIKQGVVGMHNESLEATPLVTHASVDMDIDLKANDGSPTIAIGPSIAVDHIYLVSDSEGKEDSSQTQVKGMFKAAVTY